MKKQGNEIIIGVTKYPQPKKDKKTEEQKTKEKKVKKQNKQQVEKTFDPQKELAKKKVFRILRWTGLFTILIGLIAFAMISPIFNISEIKVNGNKNISQDKIIFLSDIKLGENLFRINKKEIISCIKQNGYIESVIIKRKIPNKVEINIVERQVNFVIECGSGYAYINNQGYVLEVNSEKYDVPILLGTTTQVEQLIEANRLNSEDLKKLGTVLKIVNICKVNDISELITSIDISDSNNYTLYFENEKKTAYLGDCSDLETRVLYLAAMLKSEEGNAGEIFVNMNLNKENAFFRKEV